MRLTLPYINALQLLEIAPAQIRQYQSYHMDDWMLQNRLNQWQSGSYASPVVAFGFYLLTSANQYRSANNNGNRL
jgi:hypothetical protein